MIETSLCVTSYNRPDKLKEALSSFFKTNTYDLSKLELIIVDNGSTDKNVIDFIKSYSPDCNYKTVLNKRNDYPNCLRYSKIQARNIASGQFFIDCPDDHVFVCKSRWIEDCISRIKIKDDVGAINYYAQPSYRFTKQNNEMSIDPDNPDFFIASKKGYADFHIMSRKAYENIGEYDYKLGRRAESEYMSRSLEMGYFRNLMRYPSAICMDEGKFGEGDRGFELVEPIEKEYLEHFLSGVSEMFPVSNEALVEFCLVNGNIRVKDV